MPWPWLVLAVTLVGAWFTFNAYLPRLGRTPFIVPSFFAGWLTSELSAHHFAWQLVATVFFVWMGALEAWPGWVGLGITLASWLGLLLMVPLSGRSEKVVESALARGLGPDYRDRIAPAVAEQMTAPRPRGRLAIPFLLYDPAVEKLTDIRYAEGAGRRHLLDVYRPKTGAEGAPVLLQIHGGAWIMGEKREQALPLMLHLAARGWVCVAANYRLSPRATFPDHIVDVKRAIHWIRENIAEHGGDPDFLAITGGSAGGHLSSLAAVTANDPALQPGFEHADTSVRAAVPFYGVYDFANEFDLPGYPGFEAFLGPKVMKMRLAENRAAFEQASPMFRVSQDAPPFFVIHGTHDSLAPVEDARNFVARLRERSREAVAYAEIPGAQHAFEVFHSLRTRHVIDGVDRFLAVQYSRYLAERNTPSSDSDRAA